MNIAIFASGRGSNFSAIEKEIKNGKLPVNLKLLICDQSEAKVLQKAKRASIETALIRREDFEDKQGFEAEIISTLKKHKIDLIVLAGFMCILSDNFIKKYQNRILNIHPSLLPAFKGMHGIKDAFDYGAKITGVTVHFVDEQVDHGPIILQRPVKINKDDTLETLERKIHIVEHKLYPEAIRLVIKRTN